MAKSGSKEPEMEVLLASLRFQENEEPSSDATIRPSKSAVSKYLVPAVTDPNKMAPEECMITPSSASSSSAQLVMLNQYRSQRPRTPLTPNTFRDGGSSGAALWGHLAVNNTGEDLVAPTGNIKRPVGRNESFELHESVDINYDALLPTPQSTFRGPAKALETNDNFYSLEGDFTDLELCLPDGSAAFDLSPLFNRQRIHPQGPDPSLRSQKSGSSSEHGRHLTASPGLSMGETSAEDEEESFLDDLVLPSYFLGGPGNLTPPSDSEGKSLEKVDLQALLKSRLQFREQSQQTRQSVAPSLSGKLSSYREAQNQDGSEANLVIGSIKLDSERVRTVSDTQRRSLSKLARKESLSTNSNSRRREENPSQTASSNTTRGSSWPRNRRTQTPTHGMAPHDQHDGVRPGSAADTAELLRRRDYRVSRPPPPAPSTDRRERIRLRTVSLLPTNTVHPVADRVVASRMKQHAQAVDPLCSIMGDFQKTTARAITPIKPLNRSLSSSNLMATPSSTVRSMSRKASMQSLKENNTPLQDRPRFASPTVASMSRMRPRLNSNTFTNIEEGSLRPRLKSSSRPPSALSHRVPESRLSTPSGRPSQFLNEKTLDLVSISAVLRPRKPQFRGDGSELDTLEDLPTNHERERAVVTRKDVSRTVRSDPRLGKALPEKSIQSSMDFGKQKTQISSGTVHNLTRIERNNQRRHNAKSIGISPVGSKGHAVPQLISNVGSTNVVQQQAGMTWNSILKRWEGNEGALCGFDEALTGSIRPALIAQIISPAMIQDGVFPSASDRIPSPVNSKVVGSMVFDPARMSWFCTDEEGEDELNLADADDDDDGEMTRGNYGRSPVMDGWQRGEHDRMLKSRASFASAQSDAGHEQGAGHFWQECVDAEKRHREEMASWCIDFAVTSDGKIARDWFADLRKLVVDG